MSLSRVPGRLKSLHPVAFVGVGMLVGVALSLWPSASAQQPTPFRARGYYLTQTKHDGANAPTACAAGFHMASLWEIFDTSNLAYDTTLGFTRDDSGSGAPSAVRGWIRTGFSADSSSSVGNCNAYSSSTPGDSGMTAGVFPIFDSDNAANPWSPWDAEDQGCSGEQRVWCVEDAF